MYLFSILFFFFFFILFYLLYLFFFFFFFNDTATTEIYTLSLTTLFRSDCAQDESAVPGAAAVLRDGTVPLPPVEVRSEEHTSELQSLAYLVCRLLLDKKQWIFFCARTPTARALYTIA